MTPRCWLGLYTDFWLYSVSLPQTICLSITITSVLLPPQATNKKISKMIYKKGKESSHNHLWAVFYKSAEWITQERLVAIE